MTGNLPHVRIGEFLDSDARSALLAWTLENIGRFAPSQVNRGEPGGAFRTSVSVRPEKALRHALRGAVEARLAEILAGLRMSAFDHRFEMEAVCYNDGAYFRRHVDTGSGGQAVRVDRRISAVYYFHNEPKRFSGGQLRLHPLLPSGTPVDIEPEQNTLVAFPAFTPHEVLPVACPSRRPADARFAVNIWLHGRGAQA